MATSKLYINSTGVNIDLDTQLDVATLASASSVAVQVKRPNGTTTSWAANIVTATSKIRHTIVSGDLPISGVYKLQASITFPGNSALVYGETVSLRTYDPFN